MGNSGGGISPGDRPARVDGTCPVPSREHHTEAREDRRPLAENTKQNYCNNEADDCLFDSNPIPL